MNLKRVLPVVLLFALLVWGVYDVVNKNEMNKAAAGSAVTSTNAKTGISVSANTGIKEGDLAPDFQLETLDGRQVKLSDYRGKKVILNFWATWCPPCKAEIPDLEKFYSDYKDKGIVILGVNLTQSEKSQSAVKEFAKSYKMTYPIPLDTEGSTAAMYQVSEIPTSYIIDTKGIIRQKVFGPMDFQTMKSLLDNIN